MSPGPYSRTLHRAICWPYGGGQCLMSEVPLYQHCRLVSLFHSFRVAHSCTQQAYYTALEQAVRMKDNQKKA